MPLRMQVYTVHIKPDSRTPYESAEFVKEGFSWMAFLLGVFWALYHRLWMFAFSILAFNVALAAIVEELRISEWGASFIQIGFQVVVGYIAHDILRSHLRTQGYIIADIVAAESWLKGWQRFLERVAV